MAETLSNEDETLSNITLCKCSLKCHEPNQIADNRAEAQKPQLFAFLYDKRVKHLNRILTTIEQKTKINREQWAYVILVALALYMMLGYFAQLLCNMAGFAYPAYASVKAIRTADKEDDTQWLMYWTVFATFSLADNFASSLTSLIPTYWLFKAAFLLYLYFPNRRGTEMLFEKFVNPTISIIDDLIKTYERRQITERKPNKSIQHCKKYI